MPVFAVENILYSRVVATCSKVVCGHCKVSKLLYEMFCLFQCSETLTDVCQVIACQVVTDLVTFFFQLLDH